MTLSFVLFSSVTVGSSFQKHGDMGHLHLETFALRNVNMAIWCLLLCNWGRIGPALHLKACGWVICISLSLIHRLMHFKGLSVGRFLSSLPFSVSKHDIDALQSRLD